jgi:hypothetical protein
MTNDKWQLGGFKREVDAILRDLDDQNAKLKALLKGAKNDLGAEDYARLVQALATEQEKRHAKVREWWQEHGLDLPLLETLFKRVTIR